MAIRIEKGVVAFKKSGTIVVFPDGNDGENGEYQKFFKTKEGKELAWLFASPKFLYNHLNEERDELEELRKNVV